MRYDASRVAIRFTDGTQRQFYQAGPPLRLETEDGYTHLRDSEGKHFMWPSERIAETEVKLAQNF